MISRRICVVGLGYVGLPLACLFADKGYETVGLERDKKKVETINQGICPLRGKEPGLKEILLNVVNSGKLIATSDPEICSKADAIFICVDVPIDESQRPVLTFLESAVMEVGKRLRRGTLVVVESTLPPGTMNNFVIPRLESISGLQADKDFFIAYSPERILPGNVIESLKRNARIIGFRNERSLSLARDIYSTIVEAPIYQTDMITAEIVKTVENAYRDVQIAFANEVALACEDLGVDVFEVRRLVNTSPFRDMHLPGSGVGGHCLTKDPWLFASSITGRSLPLISTARAINDSMPEHLAALAMEALCEAGIDKSKPKVSVFGLAFRKDIGDTRNSPALAVIDILRKDTRIIVHDPYAEPPTDIDFTRDIKEALRGSDCAIFVTDHSEYNTIDLQELARLMRTRIIVDGRNLFDARKCREEGFIYRGIGKGR
ncbi:MAG: nucleotide sugar dehydrogenase [Methanomassiliicoccales archaeon]|jgi:UDP-N-acetyl-D-mannosaminuronic acid dehydrogenase|nr:nucleotide sugar dehydrogenase [Methanomassiliicoccales archaeon]